MLPSARRMSATMSALRYVTKSSRLAQAGNVANCLLRTLSTRILTANPPQLTPAPSELPGESPVSVLAVAGVRGYATAQKTTKKTATKKKAATKKKKPATKKKPAAKKKKKPAALKKKAVKKKKKAVPKVTRPKITKLPSPYAVHAYAVYVSENAKDIPNTAAPERMRRLGAQWRALSESERAVTFPMHSFVLFECGDF
jgi:outer membrane biosynthesis protein TonB